MLTTGCARAGRGRAHFLPDCDLDPVPVPAGGALEGEAGYECRSDGDCHLIVVDDEVAAGAVEHAIRFIMPNSRIRRGVYVHPATHGTPATSGPPQAPPYGTRLRLRADYPLERLPAAARVVARALQRYGMLLADGGSVTLTARSDRFTRARWAGLLGPRDLDPLLPRDFEMVEAGPRIPLTLDCVRNP